VCVLEDRLPYERLLDEPPRKSQRLYTRQGTNHQTTQRQCGIPRRKADQRDEFGYYHCVARVVDRQFLFGETEKEHLVKLMKR
jgi:hypothetical protein